MDDAASYSGANLSGTAFAQNWLDLEAEHGRSNFDQRHLLTVQFQYDWGRRRGRRARRWLAGLAVERLDGHQSAHDREWDAIDAMLPGHDSGHWIHRRDPRILDRSAHRRARRLLPQSGGVLTPASGQWGNAARNSGTGPMQFGLNAGITRTFPWGGRLNMDFRIDATNVLNHVTYSTVNTLVSSPQFGLPSGANQMRRIQTSVRMRF